MVNIIAAESLNRACLCFLDVGLLKKLFSMEQQPKSGLGRLFLRYLDHTQLDTHPVELI
jgi:hypothetical protein